MGVSKDLSQKFQENVEVFKALVRGFKVVLFLQVYWCMSLIAATRAEGGLVFSSREFQ